jgi:hypothetical protein
MTTITATAAAALLTTTMAFAQAGGQTDVPSARHQNSGHANAPGAPDQTNSGGMQSPNAGGMENTSSDQNRGRGDDSDMNGNAGGDMRPDRDRTGNRGQMDRDRMGTTDHVRINETGRGNLRLTTIQRTRIHDVVVRAHGPRLTRVNFRVGIGARVPRDVRIAVLPPEIVAIAPEWQGYSYFEYGDQIVIVDPATFAIMATLPL